MPTQDEKLKIIEELTSQIEILKNEIQELEAQKRRFTAGSLMRTGIVLLLVSVGISVAALFLL